MCISDGSAVENLLHFGSFFFFFFFFESWQLKVPAACNVCLSDGSAVENLSHLGRFLFVCSSLGSLKSQQHAMCASATDLL